jgi:hypothetical protein
MPTDDAPAPWIPILKPLRAALGVVGFGTLLYAIGFVAIRAHYAGLGVSPGAIDSQEISEEGGRFLYHLLFLPAGFLASISWVEAVVLMTASPAVILLERWLRPRFRKSPSTEPGVREDVLGAVLAAAALLVSAVLAETIWRALQIDDLLFTNDRGLALFRSEASRAQLYSEVLWRLAAVVGIAILLLVRVWQRAGLVERIFVAAQCLLASAALGAWPMVYGKLIISDLRPVVLDAAGTPPSDGKLLVRKEGKNCLIWNKSQHRLEILSLGDNQTLLVGHREHLLE